LHHEIEELEKWTSSPAVSFSGDGKKWERLFGWRVNCEEL
ncbi:hypothetical protein A2U01_0110843, partial [Trifolium medium]|nr:hypothetical protein [Trifolium medium]